MRHGQDNGGEGDGDASAPKVGNEVSGGQFNGPVGQFGHVHGDVNLNPPRSPEEAAFRARYMAKMQEAWDAEERARAEGSDGCAIAFIVFFGIVVVGFIIVAIVMAISFFSQSGPLP
ncbi:hypothetical protein ABT324_17525 [Saccharopolyspora sp. NPDC000359]|uniref:hypothetical protein n=1 Tax=Saccharopolyspora sp. NPDC000359 TaxID=3154251 RepID=UPI00331842A8